MHYESDLSLLTDQALRILRHHTNKHGSYAPVPDAIYCFIEWHIPPALLVEPDLQLHTLAEAHAKCVAAIQQFHMTAIATTLLTPGGNRYLIFAATKDIHVVLIAPILPPNFEWINGYVKPHPTRKPWVADITQNPDWLPLSPLTRLPWTETPSLEETQSQLASQFGLDANDYPTERGH